MNTLFIVGCPRSGTTMLQQALNRHSQIVIPPETKFFYYFYGRSRKRQRAQWERIQRDLRIGLPAPSQRVCAPDHARLVFHEMARAYLERLERKDVVYFGDKTPEQTSRLAAIREVFPDAKILFLYRDGRDVALSLTQVPWIKCSIYGGLLIWLYYYQILKRERRDAPPNILFLRYEDVVSNPEAELAHVLQFLELPYEPDVAYGFGNREGIPDREYAWKSRALEKITTNRIGLWQSELSARQIERLERLAGHALDDLGYERTTMAGRPMSIWFRMGVSWELLRLTCSLPFDTIADEFIASTRRVLSRNQAVFAKVQHRQFVVDLEKLEV